MGEAIGGEADAPLERPPAGAYTRAATSFASASPRSPAAPPPASCGSNSPAVVRTMTDHRTILRPMERHV